MSWEDIERIGVLGPGDRLIVEVPAGITREQFEAIKDALTDELGDRVLVLAGVTTTIDKGEKTS